MVGSPRHPSSLSPGIVAQTRGSGQTIDGNLDITDINRQDNETGRQGSCPDEGPAGNAIATPWHTAGRIRPAPGVHVMPTVACPGCSRRIDLPDHELSLPSITCAACDTTFAARGNVISSKGRSQLKLSLGISWGMCAILTALVAVIHLIAWTRAPSVIDQAAISAAAAAWTITFYVLARCHERN